MKQLPIAFLLLFSVSFFSCKDDSTTPATNDLQLTAEDVEVTEVSIRLQIAPNLQKSPSGLTLIQDGMAVASIPDPQADSLFVISGLAPKSNHTFQTKLQISGMQVYASDLLHVTTMDSTSHDFNWSIDTLGDGASSSLKDVAIVNDTCVVAVGEIHIRDSTGNWDPKFYNVAKWNGNSWKLYAFAFPLYSYDCTIAGYVPFQLNTVTVFGPGKILLNGTALWDGDSLVHLPCIPISIIIRLGQQTKTWGVSESNFYVVGLNGMILHFDHGIWSWMESGTDVDLFDVWGSPDGSVVWACGYYHSRAGTYLLRNVGTGWQVVYDGTSGEFSIRNDSLSGAYSSVFAPTKRRLYVAGAGVYQTTSETHGEATRLPFDQALFPGFSNSLRGIGSNDLVLAGYYNSLAHFNGVTWRYISGSLAENRHLRSVDQRGNLIVAVGVVNDPIDGKGFVNIGRR